MATSKNNTVMWQKMVGKIR